ncbi:hypothetical protein As57867_002178, partial [Aphanomyces stellatus]
MSVVLVAFFDRIRISVATAMAVWHYCVLSAVAIACSATVANFTPAPTAPFYSTAPPQTNFESTLFSDVYYKGDATKVAPGAAVPDFTGNPIGSIRLSNFAVLVLYPGPSFTGDPVIIVDEFPEPLNISYRSYRVLSRVALLAQLRQQLSTEDGRGCGADCILLCPIVAYELLPCKTLHVGSNISDVGAFGPAWPVSFMDIPPGCVVEMFENPNFRGLRKFESPDLGPGYPMATPLSLRTFRSGDVLPPVSDSTDVMVFNVDPFQVPPFAIKCGERMASMAILRQLVPAPMHSIDIPLTTRLVVFDSPSFQGNATTYTDTTFDLFQVAFRRLVQFRSIQVVCGDKSLPPISTPVSPSETVSCLGSTGTTQHFKRGVPYPMIEPWTCLTPFQVPPGLAVVGYDRPWLLGALAVWTSDQVTAESFRPWTARLRSMQVMRASEAPPDPGLNSIAADDDVVTVRFGNVSAPFAYVGQAVPGFGTWELPFVVAYTMRDDPSPRVDLIPSKGVVMVTYSDYNFQGNVTVYSAATPLGNIVVSSFKSYQVLRQVDIGSNATAPANPTSFAPVPPPAFVECHTSLPNLTPIFMQVGDQIGQLIHPWDTRLVTCQVPAGFVLDVFSKQAYSGRCYAWTSNVEFQAPWNTTIRSLRVWNASLWAAGKCRDMDNDMTLQPNHGDNSNTPNATSLSWLSYAIAAVLTISAFVVVVRRRYNTKQTTTISDVYTADMTRSISQAYESLVWGDMDLVRLDTPALKIISPLATGASGSISLSQFRGQPVAIKTLHHPTPFAIQRFIDEILFLDQLKSPFIVTLIGAMWTHPTNVQAVMEYMDMGDLRSYLAKTTLDGFGWQQKLECARS